MASSLRISGISGAAVVAVERGNNNLQLSATPVPPAILEAFITQFAARLSSLAWSSFSIRRTSAELRVALLALCCPAGTAPPKA